MTTQEELDEVNEEAKRHTFEGDMSGANYKVGWMSVMIRNRDAEIDSLKRTIKTLERRLAYSFENIDTFTFVRPLPKEVVR